MPLNSELLIPPLLWLVGVYPEEKTGGEAVRLVCLAHSNDPLLMRDSGSLNIDCLGVE